MVEITGRTPNSSRSNQHRLLRGNQNPSRVVLFVGIEPRDRNPRLGVGVTPGTRVSRHSTHAYPLIQCRNRGGEDRNSRYPSDRSVVRICFAEYNAHLEDDRTTRGSEYCLEFGVSRKHGLKPLSTEVLHRDSRSPPTEGEFRSVPYPLRITGLQPKTPCYSRPATYQVRFTMYNSRGANLV